MSAFGNVIKRVAGSLDDQRGVARHGIVTSVNTANGTVRLAWDEDNTLSGWLPVAQLAAGNGWSGVCFPTPGTQVFAVPDMGDSSHMVVVGAVHSTAQPAGKVTPYNTTMPVPIVPGEITFTHPSGASFRLTAGGVIEIHGTLKLDGDLLVSGQISDLNNIHATLDTLRQAYNEHMHTGVQSGGDDTGISTIQIL